MGSRDKERVSHSPGSSPKVESLDARRPTHMTFAQALKRALDGRRVQRLEWNNDEYITFHDRQLMVYLQKDQRMHPLIVSDGDVLGEDWVVMED